MLSTISIILFFIFLITTADKSFRGMSMKSTSGSSYSTTCDSRYLDGPCTEQFNAKVLPYINNNSITIADVTAFWTNRLRGELTMLSVDWHRLFCKMKKSELEFEDRVMARVLTDMLRNLRTMQRTDEILKNASQIAVMDDLKNVSCERDISGGVFFHRWLVIVNESMSIEPSLQKEYTTKRTQATLDTPIEFADIPVDTFHLSDDIEDYLCKYTVFREAYVNQIFIERAFDLMPVNASKKDFRQHILGKSMVELAQNSNELHEYQRSLLDKIYRSALLEVALDLTCNITTPPWNGKHKIKDKLFETLRRLLEEEPKLSYILDRKMRQYGA